MFSIEIVDNVIDKIFFESIDIERNLEKKSKCDLLNLRATWLFLFIQ